MTAQRTPKDRTVAQEMGVRVCACESRPAAGADVTGLLMVRPLRRKVAGLVAHARPRGIFRLDVVEIDGQFTAIRK